MAAEARQGHVLVTGGPGSGTSTLAEALAAHLAVAWVEADDYYWQPSDPPFQYKYGASERAERLLKTLGKTERAVVAGSVMGWGDAVEKAFGRIIFIHTDPTTRMARLQARERQRYGAARPGFLAWAAGYDAGQRPGRSPGKLCATSRGSRSSPHRRCDKTSERSACLIGRSSSATQPRRL
ncbi:AAA family ATPase [Salinisphaera sp. T5B8]|uniref:AAA family ATPase n=1 Tax=Salinisphaera sp. T5B8 TaxID=1304154 RepID=UPI0033404921